MSLTKDQLLRYSRQLIVDNFSTKQQERLCNASIAFVGSGGLGCSSIPYLVGSGVKKIILIDDDLVELHNLHRQIIYDENDIGKQKALVMQEKMQRLNHEVEVVPIIAKNINENLISNLDNIQLIIDGTDSYASRIISNKIAIKKKIPFISAAASSWQVQLYSFKPYESGGCYECIYPDEPDKARNCHTLGIIPSALAMAGSMLANLIIQELCYKENSALSKILQFDARTMKMKHTNIVRDNKCKACSS